MGSGAAARGPPASRRDLHLLAVSQVATEAQADEGAQLISEERAEHRHVGIRRGPLKAAAAIGGGLACLALATGGTGLVQARDLVFAQKFAKGRAVEEEVAKLWDQCGGATWDGASTCATGSRCKVINDFYSQCVPADDDEPRVATRSATVEDRAVQDHQSQKQEAIGQEEPQASHKGDGPSLFCWCVSQTTGYEVALIQKQHELGIGIFSCQGWEVFSAEPIKLSGEENSTSISGVWATWNPDSYGTKLLNTQVFLRAWDKIREGKLHSSHDWVIKVDVDAVFFPGRLRAHLGQDSWSWVTNWGGAVYLLNCAKYESMQGPLEIISRTGVDQLLDGLDTCRSSIPTSDKGEDQFVGQCLKLLGVQGIADYDLLSDYYCEGMSGPCECTSGNRLSSTFHPCKSEDSFFQCAEVVHGFDDEVRFQK